MWKLTDGLNGEDEGLEGPTGLLDSGASHPLRPSTGDEKTTPVLVTLAGDGTKILAQNQFGTIIVPRDAARETQPIVPMGALVMELGCSLTWTRNYLKLVHPKHGRLKVAIRGRCPELTLSDTLTLIRELEERELSHLKEQVDLMSARLEEIEEQDRRSWKDLLRCFVEDGRKETLWKFLTKSPYTKNLPDEVKELLLESFEHSKGNDYLRNVPLSRRQRKQLLASNSWVVHLYAGNGQEENEPLKAVNKYGRVLLEVDLASSRLWDMNLPGGVYQLLLWGAAAGKIEDIIGGPPCRTFSMLLHRVKEGMPQPARAPSFEYGVPGLDPRRQNMVHRDTALLIKQLLLWNISSIARNGNFVGFFLEHPMDPAKFLEGDPEENLNKYVSWWRLEPWRKFKELFGMMEVSYEQGALGHPTPKPTTNGTNYVALRDLDGLKMPADARIRAPKLESYQLARWALGLKRRLTTAIVGSQVSSPLWLQDEEVQAKKMSGEQRELWRKHLEADHVPYRADCSICVEAQATGRPHRKSKRHTGCSLSIDLAGPFRHQGRDLHHKDYKYLMVAAYRKPRSLLQTINADALDKELEIMEPVPEEEDLVDTSLVRGEEPEPPEEPVGGDHVDEDLPNLEELFGPEPIKAEEEGESDGMSIHGPEQSGGDEAPIGSPHLPDGEVKETLEEKIAELQKPVEMVTIFLARPMRRRTGQAALLAVQELVLQLTRAGLPVQTIHSDRAREFGTNQMKSWMADRQIFQTKTSGGEPAGNSAAERGVKWFKSRTRTLLRTSGAAPGEWPMAAAHAAASLWRKAFPKSPLLRGTSAAFGQTVWYKAKTYHGVKEKELDATKNKDLPRRWNRAWYRGPSMEVPDGHLLLREDGGLVIAKGLKAWVQEPHPEEPPLLEDLMVTPDDEEPATPTRRYRSKASLKPMEILGSMEEMLPIFEEMDLDDLTSPSTSRSRQPDGQRGSLRDVCLRIKKAEVQYTENVEDLLQELDNTKKGLEVTHNVSLDEVKRNRQSWFAAARKEYVNLKESKQAFDTVKRSELPADCQIVPGKAVFTVKPDKNGYRRKARFVACGNHIPADQQLCDLYAAGVDAVSLRTLLAVCAGRGWKAASTDIRQAFVLAPWTGGSVAIQPPTIAVQMGLVQPGEMWLVRQAIYGLRESPAVWSEFRDKELREMMRNGELVTCKLQPLVADSQIWKIVQEGGEEEPMGYAMVYVDDVLMIGEDVAVDAFYQWLGRKWECDGITELTRNSPLRFLGMELYETEKGYELGQRGFTQELLRSHGHGGSLSLLPGPRDVLVMTAEEEEAIIADVPTTVDANDPTLKQAQRRVGELLWLVSRTRPDLQYLVALMSSRVNRNPEVVNAIGERVLDYLAATIGYRLTFQPREDNMDIHVYTDSSFAPSSGRSHGAAAVFLRDAPLSWRSARQPLVTLSTAESELIEAVEGALLGLSTLGLVEELTGRKPLIKVHIDNQAALALATGSSGSWRTRHLRLRIN